MSGHKTKKQIDDGNAVSPDVQDMVDRDFDKLLYKSKPVITPALKVPKKRGRPFKEDRADWDGETPPAPKRYKRTMTIPKLTEPIRNTKLRDLIKAIYRDGALGNDRSLQADVDAIKELFT